MHKPPPLPPPSAGQGRTRLYVDGKPLLVSAELMVGLPLEEEELAQFTPQQRASLAEYARLVALLKEVGPTCGLGRGGLWCEARAHRVRGRVVCSTRQEGGPDGSIHCGATPRDGAGDVRAGHRQARRCTSR
jgi:hypothetical protein